MTKLTDTQLMMLSAGAQRDDRGIELPVNLKGGVARKVVDKLRDAGFIEEVRARGTLPVWRRAEDNQPMALRITKRGMKAISVEDDETPAEAAAQAQAPDGDHDPSKARPSKSGRQARASGSPGGGSTKPGARHQHEPKALTDRPPHRGRPESKQALVIAALRAPTGATIAAIMAVTGWQQHSVRGFFAGAVRRKLGLTLTSQKENGDRVYRILDDCSTDADRATA